MPPIPLRHLQSRSPEESLAGSFTIRDLKELMNGKDLHQEVHRHDHYLVLVLEQGKGEHEIDFIPRQVDDRVVFLMRPGQVHRLSLRAGCKGFLIQFKADFFFHKNKNSGQLLRRVAHHAFYQAGEDEFKKLLVPLRSVFAEYNEKQEGYREVIKANLAVFFIGLLRLSGGPLIEVKSYVQGRMDELHTLLEKHLSTHKQVSAYAEMMHLSPYQLNAITKASLGKSCSTLIRDEIILEAKRQLLAGSAQVSEIAWQLGYEDASYFIRFFRKHSGYSPEAFRKKFR